MACLARWAPRFIALPDRVAAEEAAVPVLSAPRLTEWPARFMALPVLVAADDAAIDADAAASAAFANGAVDTAANVARAIKTRFIDDSKMDRKGVGARSVALRPGLIKAPA